MTCIEHANDTNFVLSIILFEDTTEQAEEDSSDEESDKEEEQEEEKAEQNEDLAVCGFCHKGKEPDTIRMCGPLRHKRNIYAHQKCMVRFNALK